MEINSNRKNRNREQIKNVLDNEKAITGTVEQYFEEDTMVRLESTIPSKIKRDLGELKSCIDTKGTKSIKADNRLLAEAMADLFVKYASGNGEFKLTDTPLFRGHYDK